MERKRKWKERKNMRKEEEEGEERTRWKERESGKKEKNM